MRFRQLRRLWLLSVCIMASAASVCAQTTKIEELEKRLKQNMPDSSRLIVYAKLAKAYSSVDPQKKFQYAHRYGELASKLGIDSLVVQSYVDIGVSYGIQSHMDSAMFYFSKAYKLSETIDYDPGRARALACLGFAYARLDDRQEAISHYKRALELFRKTHNSSGINQTYVNIGSLYFDMAQHELAEKYFHDAYVSYLKDGNELGAASAMFSLGNAARAGNKYDQAFNYYKRSFDIRQRLGDHNGVALSKWGMGMVYSKKKQYEKALLLFSEALAIDRELGEVYHGSAVLISVAETYLEMKQYDKAEANALQALRDGEKIKSNVASSVALEVLTKIAEAQGDIPKAFGYQKRFLELRSEMDNERAIKDITLMEFKRVLENNDVLEKNNERMDLKNTGYFKTILIVSTLLVLVILLLVLYYRRNKEKQIINHLLEVQKNEIASQNQELAKLNAVKNKFFSIVSHDLRSPMANLQLLFALYREGQLEERELNELLFRLEETILSTSEFLDNLLEWSKNQLDGMVVKPESFKISDLVKDNIRLMDSKIKLKQLRVDDRIPEELCVYADRNMIDVVVRNLISNSLKFCSPGDEVVFTAEARDKEVLFSVQDSGPGISEKEQEKLFDLENTISSGSSGEKGHHIGLILCRDMILLNGGRIWVESEIGKGTKFFVSLPTSA